MPALGRRSVADCVVDDTLIPAGSDVLVSAYVTHRHPLHWEDPERFDPDRFTPEREAARHRYAWFPFGGGPRACIGQHFSMLESVLTLAVLLRAFEVEAVDTDVSLSQDITLVTRGPVRIKLTKRPNITSSGSDQVFRARRRPATALQAPSGRADREKEPAVGCVTWPTGAERLGLHFIPWEIPDPDDLRRTESAARAWSEVARASSCQAARGLDRSSRVDMSSLTSP